ncbi:MAG TPA: hypothetical protein VN155_16835 [Devosia sp.]|nr:hypothetical protein [Devosia sp.]
MRTSHAIGSGRPLFEIKDFRVFLSAGAPRIKPLKEDRSILDMTHTPTPWVYVHESTEYGAGDDDVTFGYLMQESDEQYQIAPLIVGGNIIYGNCDGLDDALDMRERYAIGFPAEAVKLTRATDATKNRMHAAMAAVEGEIGERPYRVPGHVPELIVYAAGPFLGEAYTEETPAHAIALERLLDSVREGSVHQIAAE